MPDPSGRGSSRWPLLAIAGVLLVALATAGIIQLLDGGDNTVSSGGRPTPDSLSPDQVIVVAGLPPSQGVVTKDDLDHAIELQAAQAKLKTVPSPTAAKYDELQEAALGELLDSIWIRGEADEMGISVSAAQAAEELATIKKQNFKTDTAYEHFLRSSHFTRKDVEERVELQLLSTKIQEQVSAKAQKPATTGVSARRATQLRKQAEQKAFEDFVDDYQSHWQSETVCAPAYVFERCFNGQDEGTPASGGAQAIPTS